MLKVLVDLHDVVLQGAELRLKCVSSQATALFVLCLWKLLCCLEWVRSSLNHRSGDMHNSPSIHVVLSVAFFKRTAEKKNTAVYTESSEAEVAF